MNNSLLPFTVSFIPWIHQEAQPRSETGKRKRHDERPDESEKLAVNIERVIHSLKNTWTIIKPTCAVLGSWRKRAGISERHDGERQKSRVRKYREGKIETENIRKEKNEKKEKEREKNDEEKRWTGCRDCCKEDRRNLKNLVWFSFVSVACEDTWTAFNYQVVAEKKSSN